MSKAYTQQYWFQGMDTSANKNNNNSNIYNNNIGIYILFIQYI